ncbi:hypothetical protein TWF281_008915 [Arthrobotrys megalospora]
MNDTATPLADGWSFGKSSMYYLPFTRAPNLEDLCIRTRTFRETGSIDFYKWLTTEEDVTRVDTQILEMFENIKWLKVIKGSLLNGSEVKNLVRRFPNLEGLSISYFEEGKFRYLKVAEGIYDEIGKLERLREVELPWPVYEHVIANPRPRRRISATDDQVLSQVESVEILKGWVERWLGPKRELQKDLCSARFKVKTYYGEELKEGNVVALVYDRGGERVVEMGGDLDYEQRHNGYEESGEESGEESDGEQSGDRGSGYRFDDDDYGDSSGSEEEISDDFVGGNFGSLITHFGDTSNREYSEVARDRYIRMKAEWARKSASTK